MDRPPACGFCDGTGVWADQEGDPDPCPLCEGTGITPSGAPDDAPVGEAALPVRRARMIECQGSPDAVRIWPRKGNIDDAVLLSAVARGASSTATT